MSSPSAIARPYARAAFGAARDTDQLSQWHESLLLAAEVAQHPQMRALLANPLAARSDCIELILEAVASRSRVDLRPLLTIMAENRRLPALAEVAEQFTLLKAEHEGTQPVEITSAVELSAGQKQALEQRLGERFGRRIDAVYSVDDKLIGGIRVRAGDTVHDASMHDQLRRLAEVINQA
jgi:F-type H+-transporting ATPase subunit delta